MLFLVRNSTNWSKSDLYANIVAGERCFSSKLEINLGTRLLIVSCVIIYSYIAAGCKYYTVNRKIVNIIGSKQNRLRLRSKVAVKDEKNKSFFRRNSDFKPNLSATLQKTAAVIFFLILFGSLLKSYQRTKNAESLIEKSQTKLEKAKQEEKELQSKLEMTQSEAFIEEQLRDKLGLAKEGEIILVLPDNETLKKLAPIVPIDVEVKPKPNYLKWMDLFI